jgi:hypothetical protein
MRGCSVIDQFMLRKKRIVHWRPQPGDAVDTVQGINDCLFWEIQETHQCIVRDNTQSFWRWSMEYMQ